MKKAAILANAIIIPFVLKFAYGMTDLIPYMMLTVGIGEVLAVGVLGNLLMLALEPKGSFIFGNEGSGISPEILDLTDWNVFIPMAGTVESLNVSSTAAIILFYYLDDNEFNN